MAKGRLSCVGAGLTSCLELPIPAQTVIQDLRVLCLHGNSISSLHGIEHMHQLVDLNASSNNIEALRPLQNLTSMTSINLASNRLQNIEGLEQLTRLERLIIPHNYLTSLSSLAALPGYNYALETLEVHNNQLSTVQDLASLRAFPNLHNLKLQGASPGNPVCKLLKYRQLVAFLLPQLKVLDGQDVTEDRNQLLQQQQTSALLPLQIAPQPVSLPEPLTIVPHCAPMPVLRSDPYQSAQLSSNSTVPSDQALVMLPDRPDVAQENRIAAIEARLHNMLQARHRSALAPADNLLHRSQFPPTTQIRKIKPAPVVHEVACQTATSSAQLDRLQRDAVQLKHELEVLATELESRTSKAAVIEEQAEALVQEAQDQAASKVLLNNILQGDETVQCRQELQKQYTMLANILDCMACSAASKLVLALMPANDCKLLDIECHAYAGA